MSGGIASKTIIRFGDAVGKRVSAMAPELREFPSLLSPHYLFFVYHKIFTNGWHGFLIIQGSKKAGDFTVELGISNRKEMPKYLGSVKPFLGVDGTRERLARTISRKDDWWHYRSAEELDMRLEECLQELNPSFMIVLDTYLAYLRREMSKYLAMIKEWVEGEKAGRGKPLGSRFDNLPREKDAFEYVSGMYSPQFLEKFILPNLKGKYSDKHWLSCHTFIMARILEQENSSALDDAFLKDDVTMEDEIHKLTKVLPWTIYELKDAPPEEKLRYYAFTKGFSAVEAFLTAEPKKK
jgi:hypothetical protein